MNTAPRHEARIRRPANILVVEDELLIRLDIARELAGAGYKVIEAANAAEAIAVLESGHAVDLVFSDIQMPGPVDGIGLLEIVRQRFPSIPVVLTSGGAQVDQIEGVIFLPKPYRPSDVLSTVAAQIGRKERHDPRTDRGKRAERPPD